MVLLVSALGAVRVPTADGEVANPWFTLSYLRDNRHEFLTALQEHVTLTVETVLIAVVIAFPLALLAHRNRWLVGPVLGGTGVLYTIPSLALFAFLAPFTGLTKKTVLIGLVMYALLVLVRNMLAGLDGVPEEVRESARGMGFGPLRMLWRIELPVALPTIMAGVRVATVSTVALVTVGAIVGPGGLGTLLLAGLRNNFYHAEILTAALATVLLGLVADLVLAGLTRLLTPWSRTRSTS